MYLADETRTSGWTPPVPPAGADAALRGYGRFLQPDPLGYEDGMNWYEYVGGDPVNATDPSGLVTVTAKCDDGKKALFDRAGAFVGCSSSGGAGGPGNGGAGDGLGAGGQGGSPDPVSETDAQFEAACAANPESCVTVTARIPSTQKWFLASGRYRLNKGYVRPWWDLGLEGAIAIPPLAGAAAASSVATVPILSRTMAVSRTFGVTSSRFGNSFYRGSQGSWNYGSVRLGWSYYSRTENVYFQLRVGGLHVPTPIFTPAPW